MRAPYLILILAHTHMCTMEHLQRLILLWEELTFTL